MNLTDFIYERLARPAAKPSAPLLYLSGPMTGMPELNFPAFHRAAASLRRTGYRVINPAELDAADTRELTWAEYMRRDIKVLTDCEVIALLPGWENSRGARIEKLVADALGMRVIYVDEFGGGERIAHHAV